MISEHEQDSDETRHEDSSESPRTKERVERVRRESPRTAPRTHLNTNNESGFLRHGRAPRSDRFASEKQSNNTSPFLSGERSEVPRFNESRQAPQEQRSQFNRRQNDRQGTRSNARFETPSRHEHQDRLDRFPSHNRGARANIPNPMQTRDVFEEDKSVRLQKWLSEQGVGSRREVEEWIVNGDILVDGMVASLGAKIYGHEKIMLRGQPLNLRKLDTPSLEMLIYHKPAGEIVTYDDPHGRPTVFDHLPRPREGKWVSVGRLDFNSEGLLILTNSGDIAHRLMHPSFQLEREYAARIRGELSPDARAALLRGVPLEGEKNASFLKIEDAGGRGSNHWYHVTLTEGRYREVRRMFEAVTYEVNRLIRIRYGSYQLPPQLRTGKFLRIKGEQVLALFDQISGKAHRATSNTNTQTDRKRQGSSSSFRQDRQRSDFSDRPNTSHESNDQDGRQSFHQRRNTRNTRFEEPAFGRDQRTHSEPSRRSDRAEHFNRDETRERKGFSGFLRSRGDRHTSREPSFGGDTRSRGSHRSQPQGGLREPREPHERKPHQQFDYD